MRCVCVALLFSALCVGSALTSLSISASSNGTIDTEQTKLLADPGMMSVDWTDLIPADNCMSGACQIYADLSFQIANLDTNQTFAAGELSGVNGFYTFDFDCNGASQPSTSCSGYASGGTYEVYVNSAYSVNGLSAGGKALSQVAVNYIDPPAPADVAEPQPVGLIALGLLCLLLTSARVLHHREPLRDTHKFGNIDRTTSPF
jgi:hypothetical protein